MKSSAPLIAIVDDEPSVRKALGRLIRSTGFEAIGYASGTEFLASLPARCPDCVVLDIHMPGMTGFEVQAQLQTHHSALPLIFITAYDDPDGERRSRETGTVPLLRKPFTDEQLLSAIQAALSGRLSPKT